jgi:hypothetical protein
LEIVFFQLAKMVDVSSGFTAVQYGHGFQRVEESQEGGLDE